MIAIKNPDYLKYMMSLDANGARARTVKRTTSIQLAQSHLVPSCVSGKSPPCTANDCKHFLISEFE